MVLEIKKPRPMWEILFSTHHTDVGLLYMFTSITFLMIGGALAMMIRAELFLPGIQIFPESTSYHRFFTVHGITMLLLWVIPFAAGVGNYLIPIMVRYKDMAWPKLNAVAFWMIPVAGALIWLGFSDTGWTAYPPYSITRAPGPAARHVYIWGENSRYFFNPRFNKLYSYYSENETSRSSFDEDVAVCLVNFINLLYDNCITPYICRSIDYAIY